MKKMTKRILSCLLALALVLTLMPATSVEAAAKKPKKITLKASSKTVLVGKTVKVSVKSVKPKKASKAVTFKSSNKKVATVSKKGTVKGIKAGTVTITATSKKNKKVKAKIKITVKKPATPTPSKDDESSKVFVSTTWAESALAGKVAGYEKAFVAEVSWGALKNIKEGKGYRAGHIPGAVHINSDEVEVDDCDPWPMGNGIDDIYEYDEENSYGNFEISYANNMNIRPADQLEKFMKRYNITTDTKVILYGNNSKNSAVTRVAFAMIYAGVKDVKVIDGGFDAWKAENRAVETDVNMPTAGGDDFAFGTTIPAHPEYIIDSDDVIELVKDSKFRLVSIRSEEEFKGETSGYGYISRGGEPKGAVWGRDTDDGTYTKDGKIADVSIIDEYLAESGASLAKNTVSFYCGTGWRATIPFLMAYENGYQNISVFDGGWMQYENYNSINPDKYPIQKITPEDAAKVAKGETFTKTQVWLPMPTSDDNQTISNVTYEAIGATKVEETTISDGSKALYIEWDETVAPSARKATASFDFTRKAVQAVDISGSTATEATGMDAYLGSFATSGSLTEGIVKETADSIVAGKTTLAEKALAIYEWEVKNLYRLDNVYEGCGQGKVTEILEKWKSGERAGGHCTDLNSVYVALCRAAGVPAREMFGLRANENATGGQHCRAQFYLPDINDGSWIEADPADTLKMIKGKEVEDKKATDDAALAEIFATYKPIYWTANDENWVMFSTGRDVTLSPAQAGKGGCSILNTDGTLNNFGYPYAEIDGISGYTYQADKFVYTYATTNITTDVVDGVKTKAGTITCTVDLSAGNVVK